MSLYLDTSCLLKLLLPEPESRRVAEIVADEEHVIVSSLAPLEAVVQIHWRVAGGHLVRSGARALLARMDGFCATHPATSYASP